MLLLTAYLDYKEQVFNGYYDTVMWKDLPLTPFLPFNQSCFSLWLLNSLLSLLFFRNWELFPCGNSAFLVPVALSGWTSWSREGFGLMSAIDHNTG